MILPLSDKDQGDPALAPALADFIEPVLGRRAGILPDPVLCVAVPLEYIDRHLVAELAAEIDQQRDRRERKQRNVPRLMHIHAGLVEAFDALLDAPAGLLDEGLAFRVDRCEIDQVALGVRGIPGSDRIRDLRDRDGDGLSRDPRLKLHYCGFLVRAEPGNMEYAVLMGFLVFLRTETGYSSG